MEENVTENNVLGTDLGGMGEIQLGEIPNEDILVVYLSRDEERGEGPPPKNVRKLHDINECKKYKAEHCICSSKMHYEIEGSVLCVRDMKPFIYISKMSILCQSKAKKPKKNMDT